MIPEEIYQAEKLGRDLVWPGTEADSNEDIDDINEEIQFQNTPQSHTHHDSHQSLSNFSTPNGYSASNQDPNYGTQSTEDINQSSGYNNANNPQYHNNRNSSSQLNYSNTNNGKDNHCSTPSTKKTNMAKSNSLSDYNIYNNGKLSLIA